MSQSSTASCSRPALARRLNMAQTIDELMEELRPHDVPELHHPDGDQHIAEEISSFDEPTLETQPEQVTSSPPGYNWVIHSNGHPSTGSAMDAVIHPLADAVRLVVQAQDDLSWEMTRHEKSLAEIQERQHQILENVASLKVSISASMERPETKEDPTIRVLKASIKLLQDQHSEMKKQLVELKNREEGEVTDTYNMPKENRVGLHPKSIAKDFPTPSTESSPPQQADSLPISGGIERDLVDRELSSLTRRVAVLFRDVDSVNRDVERLGESFQKGKDTMEDQQIEMMRRITALEKAFVHETNEQKLSLTRTRTLTMAPVEGLKHQLYEIWRCLLNLEQRDTGERPKSVDRRQARCLTNEGHVLYWRDKLVNASNCQGPEEKTIAFRSVANTIIKMHNLGGTRGTPMILEHMPNEKGLQFLMRCVGWWESSYNDAKALRSMFGLLGGIKRGLSAADEEEGSGRDPKRLLLTSKMKDVSLGSPKELLGSHSRRGGSLSSSNTRIPTGPMGPNGNKVRNEHRHIDARPIGPRDFWKSTRTEDVSRRPSVKAYHVDDRETFIRRGRGDEYRASPTRSFYP